MATKKPIESPAETLAEPRTEAAEPALTAAPAYMAPHPDSLVIGEVVWVTVQPDVLLLDNETGQHFVPGVATRQHVSPTTLRRLQDGDLQQVEAPR